MGQDGQEPAGAGDGPGLRAGEGGRAGSSLGGSGCWGGEGRRAWTMTRQGQEETETDPGTKPPDTQ